MKRVLLALAALALGTLLRAAETVPAANAPSPAPTTIPAAARDHVRGMLDEGFTIGKPHLQAAEEHLAKARRLLPHDLRLEYAHALILYKQLQRKAALARLEDVAKSDRPAAWPAWQALILIELADKDLAPSLARLDTFAAAVARDETDPQAAAEAACWIGRVLESLDFTVTAEKPRALVVEHNTAIPTRFPGRLAEALEQGREAAREQHATLQEQAEDARTKVTLKQERNQEQQTAKLEFDQDRVEKQKTEAAKTAEGWKTWLDEQLAGFDKQIGLLEKDYNYLNKRLQSLQVSTLQLQQEIQILQQNLNNPRNTNNFNMRAQLQQAEALLVRYETETLTNNVQLAKTIQSANGVLQQRAAAVAQYEKETGQLVKKNAALEKWGGRLDAQKRKAAAKPAAKKSLPGEQKVKSLRSYVSLDLDREKQRLFESFGITPAPKPEKK